MPTLYEAPPTRSQRVKWALHELGVEHESKKLDFAGGEHKSSGYLKIHPLGVVPGYAADNYSMFESAAIVMQLVDENLQRGLAPATNTANRSSYYQWILFATAELDHRMAQITQHEMLLPEDKRNAAISNAARNELTSRSKVLNDRLKDSPYIAGEAFSGADIVLGYNCFWASFSGLFEQYAHVLEYHEKLKSRPAYKQTFDT